MRALAAVVGRAYAAHASDRRRLRDVAARAFRAQETERSRIAHELQDETAQTLSAVLFTLRAARASADPDARDALLDEVRSALSGLADGLRRYARGLHPPALDDLGVVAAVQAYADVLAEPGGATFTVEADELRGLLTRERELALYRVVQEAMGNAVRHAGAAAVRVEIRRGRGAVRATVRDDGAGFDPAARESAHPCLGLVGMRERARYAGGSAEVRSAPGRGTVVEVELPTGRDGESAPGWPVILPSAVPLAG